MRLTISGLTGLVIVYAVLSWVPTQSMLRLLLLGLATLFSWHRWREARSHLNLIRSAERMNLALDAGDLALWDWDLTRGKFVVDQRLAPMLGYLASEFRADNQQFQEPLHPGDWPALTQILRAALKGLTPQLVLEHRMRHQDGHWVCTQPRADQASQRRDL